MTDALEEHQREALEKAYDLLKEHFDASLIVVTTSVLTGEKEQEATQVYWHGGYMHALGHAEHARFKVRAFRDVPEKDPGE